jgi:hypothetical protein
MVVAPISRSVRRSGISRDMARSRWATHRCDPAARCTFVYDLFARPCTRCARREFGRRARGFQNRRAKSALRFEGYPGRSGVDLRGGRERVDERQAASRRNNTLVRCRVDPGAERECAWPPNEANTSTRPQNRILDRRSPDRRREAPRHLSGKYAYALEVAGFIRPCFHLIFWLPFSIRRERCGATSAPQACPSPFASGRTIRRAGGGAAHRSRPRYSSRWR